MIYRYIPLLDDAGKVVVRVPVEGEWFQIEDNLRHHHQYMRCYESYPIYRRVEVTGEDECKIAFAEMYGTYERAFRRGEWEASRVRQLAGEVGQLEARFLFDERTPALADEMRALAAAMKGGE